MRVKFNILCRGFSNDVIRHEMKGYVIDKGCFGDIGDNKLILVLHRPIRSDFVKKKIVIGKKGWVVSEYTTGLAFTGSYAFDTQEEAVSAACKQITKYGIVKVMDRIKGSDVVNDINSIKDIVDDLYPTEAELYVCYN